MHGVCTPAPLLGSVPGHRTGLRTFRPCVCSPRSGPTFLSAVPVLPCVSPEESLAAHGLSAVLGLGQ